MATIKSIEEKAKRYDEALKVLHKYDGANIMFSQSLKEEMFPELKEESEDERIRRAIIDDIQCMHREYSLFKDFSKEAILAWLEKQGTPAKLSEEEQNRFAKGVLTSCALSFIDYLDAHKYEGKMCVSNGECEDIENAFHNAMWDRLHRYYCKYIEKQGEQKPILDVEIPFGAKDSELQEASYNILNGYHAEIEDNKVVIKKGEQKPAWTEEDDYNLQCCIAKVQYDIDNGRIGRNRELLTWLKSLKDRYTWKPSDEQIKSVKEAACYSSVFSEKTINNLISLSEQLKNLREEQL